MEFTSAKPPSRSLATARSRNVSCSGSGSKALTRCVGAEDPPWADSSQIRKLTMNLKSRLAICLVGFALCFEVSKHGNRSMLFDSRHPHAALLVERGPLEPAVARPAAGFVPAIFSPAALPQIFDPVIIPDLVRVVDFSNRIFPGANLPCQPRCEIQHSIKPYYAVSSCGNATGFCLSLSFPSPILRPDSPVESSSDRFVTKFGLDFINGRQPQWPQFSSAHGKQKAPLGSNSHRRIDSSQWGKRLKFHRFDSMDVTEHALDISLCQHENPVATNQPKAA